MASFSQLKKGGGFLDEVDVVIKDAVWTDEFNGEPFVAGKIPSYDGKGKIDKPHTLNLFVTVRVDGADEDTSTTLKAANNFDDFEISEEDHKVTAGDGGKIAVSANSAAGKFLSSFCAPSTTGALADDEFDQDETLLDTTPIIGRRVRLVQRVDAERTKKYGQKIDKKTKKGYDRKDLVVAEVYPADEKPAKGGKSSTSSKGSSKSKKDDDEVDIDQLAIDTLKEILSDNDGKLPKSKLSMAVLKKLQKHDNREDVRKLLGSDKFLEQEDGWTYAKASKTQLVELVDEE
jgi:hypothetical protein